MPYKIVEPSVSMTWENTVKNLESQLNDLDKEGCDVIAIVPFTFLGTTNRMLIIAREKE
jgi:hypothetical protein